MRSKSGRTVGSQQGGKGATFEAACHINNKYINNYQNNVNDTGKVESRGYSIKKNPFLSGNSLCGQPDIVIYINILALHYCNILYIHDLLTYL